MGGMAQAEAVTVTPGSGGWELELVQAAAREPEAVEEPFELIVLHRGTEQRFSGCFWNETEIVSSRTGLRMIRRGFAMSREVVGDD